MKRKQLLINIIIASLLALCTILISFLSSILPNELPPIVRPYLHFTLPSLALVTVVYIALIIWQIVRQSHVEDPVVKLNHQNRQILLERVRSTWIKGVLEKSLYDATCVILALKEQPDAIVNPWRFVYQQPHQQKSPLPPGIRITQVYLDAGGELLILGEPGSGKTTLLLELARDLLDRSDQDDTLQIPVVFNLSSWAKKKQPITDWLVEELYSKYQVPQELGQEWINTDQIHPLLDGLDEVAPNGQSACVDAINAYRRAHMVSMVVCSRTAEYFAQTKRIVLQNAVTVQPLTPQQVDDYLSSAGGRLATVRVALRKDKILQELATTPLMLNVLALTYDGISVEDLIKEDEEVSSELTIQEVIQSLRRMRQKQEAMRREVFAKYVQSMLRRRGVQTHYTQQQTIHWLTWLAWQMTQHRQSEFYIEQMQPTLLFESQRQSFRSTSNIVRGLLVGLLGGLLGGLLLGLFNGVIAGVFQGVFLGLLYGLLYGCLLSRSSREIKPVASVVWSWMEAREGLSKYLPFGLVVGLVIGLLGGQNYFGLVLGALGKLANSLGDGIFSRLLGGLLIGLSFGLLSGLLTGLTSGLSSKRLEKSRLLKPNEGIWISARNSVFTGIIGGLSTGLLFGLLFAPFTGVLFGIGTGLLMALVNGGNAFLQHFVLRFLLWRAGSLPLNYPRFLDQAAERILLRKVGGGYIFVHRLLQDYFASLDSSSSTKEEEGGEKSRQIKVINEAILTKGTHTIYVQRYIYPTSTYIVFRKPYNKDEEFVVSADATKTKWKVSSYLTSAYPNLPEIAALIYPIYGKKYGDCTIIWIWIGGKTGISHFVSEYAVAGSLDLAIEGVMQQRNLK